MPATTAVMTVEQFLALPEEATFRRELIRGEMVEMGNARSIHETIKGLIAEALAVYASQNKHFFCVSESMFQIGGIDACVPDVALIEREWAFSADPAKRFQGAPAVAVEVVSSESALRVEQKVEIYLSGGSRAVWVIYPEERLLTAHYPGGVSRRLHAPDTLAEPELLPGFSLALSELFKPLT